MTPLFMARQIALPLLIGLLGCGRPVNPLHPIVEAASQQEALGSKFDPQESGTIHGQVIWHGPAPTSHSFKEAGISVGVNSLTDDASNHLLPQIDAKAGGLKGVVVFLRTVDSQRSHPWNLPTSHVVMEENAIVIEENDKQETTGFLRAGDSIEMVSRNNSLEILRARGASFFSLTFPKANKPLRRALTKEGCVEFSSGTGHYTARCWIFVATHPYYTRTDSEGAFVLENVPDGIYELVCWLPNWNVERFDRDPENHYVSRVWFRAPLEKSMAVRVVGGQITEAKFAIAEDEFISK